jgi:dGTPase
LRKPRKIADDICYCLSDIADAFEKGIITSRDFLAEFQGICKESNVDIKDALQNNFKKVQHIFNPESSGKLENFGYQVAIWVSREIMEQASKHFSENIEKYVAGTAREISKELPSGKLLECFKVFSRRFIYTNHEVQRIEIAGNQIVEGLLNHFGALLKLTRSDFEYFVRRNELRKHSGLDIEWRIYNQLSKRMIRSYLYATQNGCTDEEEWICRARLITDYISGLADHSALKLYQNFMGISLMDSW